jgi:hypothetical protein
MGIGALEVLSEGERARLRLDPSAELETRLEMGPVSWNQPG